MKLGVSQQCLKKYSNIIFHENRPVGAELCHADRWIDGQTDRHDEAHSRFS
jgi:hypothetical protein